MPLSEMELREQVEQLRAENERLRNELSRAKADRDRYRRELFLAFPPPNYTDEEISHIINNRVPANGLLDDLDAIIREGK
jgi:predicted RNase H-like nuclease (RuvC/YqgF family)